MGDSRYADVSRGPIAESDKSAYANNDVCEDVYTVLVIFDFFGSRPILRSYSKYSQILCGLLFHLLRN